MAHADAFLESGAPFDMFFLGYSPKIDTSYGLLADLIAPDKYMNGSVAMYDDDAYQCVYRLHDWLCTQAYVISRDAMAAWRNLTYVPRVTAPIDVLLATRFDNDRFFTVRPQVAFQRYHGPTTNVTAGDGAASSAWTGSAEQTWKFVPGVVYSLYGAPRRAPGGVGMPLRAHRRPPPWG